MKTIYRLQSVTGIMSTHTFSTYEDAILKCNFLNNLTSYNWRVIKLVTRE